MRWYGWLWLAVGLALLGLGVLLLWPNLVLGGALGVVPGFSQIMLTFAVRDAGREAAAIDPERPR